MTYVLLLLLACAPEDGSCGEVIQVSTGVSYTDEEGVMLDHPCVVEDGERTDYSACCPEEYDFVYGTGSYVLCEERCNL